MIFTLVFYIMESNIQTFLLGNDLLIDSVISVEEIMRRKIKALSYSEFLIAKVLIRKECALLFMMVQMLMNKSSS